MIGKHIFAEPGMAQFAAQATCWAMVKRPKAGSGNFIALWRHAAGLTQEQLAEMAGMTAPGISRLESGKAGYTKSSLENIALALQVEPWQLLGQRPDTGTTLIQKLQNAAPEQIAQIEAVAETLLRYTPPPAKDDDQT